jgi:transposase
MMGWTARNGIISAKLVVLVRNQQRGPSMAKISMIGLDLEAKDVFQIHGIDAAGKVVLRRQLRRGQMEKFFAQLPPTVVGMEACGGAHHWARLFQKLGHEVRIMPPAYVKPYGAPRRRVLPVEEGSTQRVVD